MAHEPAPVPAAPPDEAAVLRQHLERIEELERLVRELRARLEESAAPHHGAPHVPRDGPEPWHERHA